MDDNTIAPLNLTRDVSTSHFLITTPLRAPNCKAASLVLNGLATEESMVDGHDDPVSLSLAFDQVQNAVSGFSGNRHGTGFSGNRHGTSDSPTAVNDGPCLANVVKELTLMDDVDCGEYAIYKTFLCAAQKSDDNAPIGIKLSKMKNVPKLLEPFFPGYTDCISVDSVVEDSLAEKAGVRQHDILCWVASDDSAPRPCCLVPNCGAMMLLQNMSLASTFVICAAKKSNHFTLFGSKESIATARALLPVRLVQGEETLDLIPRVRVPLGPTLEPLGRSAARRRRVACCVAEARTQSCNCRQCIV